MRAASVACRGPAGAAAPVVQEGHYRADGDVDGLREGGEACGCQPRLGGRRRVGRRDAEHDAATR